MLALRFASGDPPDYANTRAVNVLRDNRGEICARAFAAPDGRRWIDWPGIGVFAFSDLRRPVQVWPALSTSPPIVSDTFARMVQPVVLQALGYQALHASAVVGSDGAFALCGRSGSGKSTLAFALRQFGFAQFADDSVVLGLDQDRILAHALPFVPRLREPSRAHFASVSELADTPLAEFAPEGMAPMIALFVLQQDPNHLGRPQIRSIRPSEAFSAVLTHAHCFDPNDSSEARRLVSDYLALVERVSVFSVCYRPALDHLPELAAAIAATGRGGCQSSPAVSSSLEHSAALPQ